MLEKEQGRQLSRFSEGEGIIEGEERKHMGKETCGTLALNLSKTGSMGRF